MPHKVKHMLWRAFHNAIPTLCSLWRRNVVSSTICLGYKAGYEDTIHALRSYCSLFVVWKDYAMLMKLLRFRPCACDATGKVIDALSQQVPLPSSVAMVEALAYRRAMEFNKEIAALDCIIEGDAEVVLKAIWNDDFSHLKVEDEGDHVEVQVGPRSNTIGPELISSTKCLITIRIEVLPNPLFQAQLDSIDEDLARYDTMEEGKRSDSLAQSRGVGSNVVGSTIFIKKPVYPDRATQTSSKEFKAQPSAEIVRQVQVCAAGEEDVLIWPLIADDGYSV
nr:hypothetical protein CFP56_06257 [Quercus suber]